MDRKPPVSSEHKQPVGEVSFWRGQYVTVVEQAPGWSGTDRNCPCGACGAVIRGDLAEVGQTLELQRFEQAHFDEEETDGWYYYANTADAGSADGGGGRLAGYGRLRPATPDEEAVARLAAKPGS